MTDDDRVLAVFIDFENLALGFQGRTGTLRHRPRARAAASRRARSSSRRPTPTGAASRPYTAPVPRGGHRADRDPHAGADRQELGRHPPGRRRHGPAWSKDHVDTFVIVSGDTDFSPLVSKLKENGKHVIGLGMKDSTSELLRDNCDEFIYYEDLAPAERRSHQHGAGTRQEAERGLRAADRLPPRPAPRESKTFWASMIKETMQRKKPSFNESYYGFKSFGQLLDAAAAHGLVTLGRDAAGRRHTVTAFGEDVDRAASGQSQPAQMRAPAPAQPQQQQQRDPAPSRSRSRGGRSRSRTPGHLATPVSTQPQIPRKHLTLATLTIPIPPARQSQASPRRTTLATLPRPNQWPTSPLPTTYLRRIWHPICHMRRRRHRRMTQRLLPTRSLPQIPTIAPEAPAREPCSRPPSPAPTVGQEKGRQARSVFGRIQEPITRPAPQSRPSWRTIARRPAASSQPSYAPARWGR